MNPKVFRLLIQEAFQDVDKEVLSVCRKGSVFCP